MTAAPDAPELEGLSQTRIDQAKTINSLADYAFGWADTDAAGASPPAAG